MDTALNFYNYCIKRSGSELNNYKKTIFFKGLIKEIDDKLQSIDSKYLFTMEDLPQGTEISCGNINYLVMTRNEKVNGVYYKYTIQKEPYFINFISGGVLQRIPSIIETKTIDVQTGQSIILPIGKVIVTISRNNTTDKIAMNDRFITMGSAWKTSGLDKSLDGIIKVNANMDETASIDDLVNEIPNNAQKPSYSFIISPNPISIKKGQTQQLTVVLNQNGIKVKNPTLIYTSSDTSIITVDSNGLVTGINEGSCNIDITYHGDYDTSSTSINIEVAAVAEHNYVISVSPDNILLDIGKIQQIISSVTDKGTAISSPTLTYSSDNTAVATVNNTGLVTGISVGTANITVSYVGEDGNTYSKTIPIVINAVVAKTIAITSTATNPNKIKVNNTQNYTITETSNENIVNDTFTLTESGCDPSYYSLTVIDNNNFSITNLKGDGTEYLTITVTSATNATVSGSIKIRLAGRW
ncbi:Ig-like domain-containing protein [Clostridium ljungdahlii]|uniref:Bacterial Ig-like domain (Group 2) n=1 Tax=Clostridium ljungdahlii (strain ATCC 55383 / DSM 13528 / PETC) TaxID=748727 RepID=D8GU91_CLOLD|nr:Ig-like domain-containing protein [Clostridium ljungdahlii]ADK14754.1 conserved hypothetical protein [Clostridium ljungdahlii DSM 13528]OAA84111.1 Bacterial Ig-like domain (group 2) [Clostridium ljungdahlii DSM 13528]